MKTTVKTISSLLICVLALCLGAVGTGCTYHNDDNPNVYPDIPDPEPEPEPEPEPTNEKYAQAIYQPNCYMIRPGESISIPILKAYAIWSLNPGALGEEDFTSATPEATLLWQDSPGLIKNVGLIQASKTEDSDITVSVSPGMTGNAVVAVRIGKEIRWSWHIWVTPYNPDSNPVEYGKLYTWDNNADGVPDYTLMDRNLGATNAEAIIGNNTADSLAACGLLYQWGRKDPFPGDSKFARSNRTDYTYFDSKPIYDWDGNLLTEGSQQGGTGIRSIKTNEDNTHSGLWKAITQPMVVWLGTSSFNDWMETKTDSLWNGKQGKTPFDPCPKGWRVPVNKNDQFVWNKLEQVNSQYSPIGVVPLNGFRYRNGGGCLKNSGFQATLWTGNMVSSSGNVYVLEMYRSYDQTFLCKKDIAPPSDGCGIRCVRDD